MGVNKLNFEIIWVDQSEDFTEIQINLANERLNALCSCYTSLEELKKQWQKDLITQVLSGKILTWQIQGSSTETVTILIEKTESKGTISVIFDIAFDKHNENKHIEKCVINLIFEPAQLDSFCEQIQQLVAKIGETANIE